MRLSLLPFVLLFLSCGSGSKTENSAEGCASIEDVGQQDECWSRIAVEVYRQNPEEGEALVERISDPLVRDYVLLAFTREIDPSTARWCQRIQNTQMRSRCRVLVSRPHLHQELVGGGPGRPPPGTMGPGGNLNPDALGGDSSDHGRPPPPPPGSQ